MPPAVLTGMSKPGYFSEYEPESAHTRAGGTGLGLRIARILARSMGGDLVYGEGAFVLSLPAERSGS